MFKNKSISPFVNPFRHFVTPSPMQGKELLVPLMNFRLPFTGRK